jgi:hypothetical protein
VGSCGLGLSDSHRVRLLAILKMVMNIQVSYKGGRISWLANLLSHPRLYWMDLLVDRQRSPRKCQRILLQRKFLLCMVGNLFLHVYLSC